MSHVGKAQRTARPGCGRRLRVIGVLSLCVSPALSHAEPRTFDAVIIGYVVAADAQSRSRAVSRVFARDIEYDQTLRKPAHDNRPVPVDCKETTWFGVVYVLRSSRAVPGRPLRSSMSRGSVGVRYVWEHSDVVLKRGYLDHYHDVDFARFGKTALGTEFLRLRKEIKIDGLVHLTASVDGEPILEVTFELTGCATPG